MCIYIYIYKHIHIHIGDERVADPGALVLQPGRYSLYYVILCHIISCCIILYYVIMHYMLVCHITLCYITVHCRCGPGGPRPAGEVSVILLYDMH